MKNKKYDIVYDESGELIEGVFYEFGIQFAGWDPKIDSEPTWHDILWEKREIHLRRNMWREV